MKRALDGRGFDIRAGALGLAMLINAIAVRLCLGRPVFFVPAAAARPFGCVALVLRGL